MSGKYQVKVKVERCLDAVDNTFLAAQTTKSLRWAVKAQIRCKNLSLCFHIWEALSKKVPPNMRKICGFTPPCLGGKSHWGINPCPAE